MVQQTRAVLEDYARHGGSFRECVLEGVGHTPFIETPQTFNRLLANFLGGMR